MCYHWSDDPTTLPSVIRTSARGIMAIPHPHWTTPLAMTRGQRQALEDAALAEAAREVGFPDDDPCAELTSRQRAILRLIASGKGQAGAAAALGISPQTVKNHLTNAYQALGLTKRGNGLGKSARAAYLLGLYDGARDGHERSSPAG